VDTERSVSSRFGVFGVQPSGCVEGWQEDFQQNQMNGIVPAQKRHRSSERLQFKAGA